MCHNLVHVSGPKTILLPSRSRLTQEIRHFRSSLRPLPHGHLQRCERNFHVQRGEGGLRRAVPSDPMSLVPELTQNHKVSPAETTCHFPGERHRFELCNCGTVWPAVSLFHSYPFLNMLDMSFRENILVSTLGCQSCNKKTLQMSTCPSGWFMNSPKAFGWLWMTLPETASQIQCPPAGSEMAGIRSTCQIIQPVPTSFKLHCNGKDPGNQRIHHWTWRTQNEPRICPPQFAHLATKMPPNQIDHGSQRSEHLGP